MSDIVKMVDIVKALRAVDHNSVEDCFMLSPLFAKAADEIERLRSENATLRTRLAEAEKVIKPFARAASVMRSTWQDHETHWREDDVAPYPVTVGHLRAARAWKEASNG